MNNEKIVSQWQMTDVMAKPVKVAVGKDRSGKRPALAWNSSDCFESFSPLNNWGSNNGSK